jgi:hypothetical protein
MEQEYTTSTGYKILYVLCALALIGFTVFLPFADKIGGIHHYPDIIILPSIGLIVAAIIAWNLFTRLLTISDKHIEYKSIWGKRKLKKEYIKGYRLGDKRIVVYPSDSGRSKINIRDYSSLNNYFEMIKSLSQYYPDLDKISYQENLDEIYNNTELGSNHAERVEKFNRSKQIALIYNIGGISIFIISLFFTEYFLRSDAVKGFLLLYPFTGFIVIIVNKGLIKLMTGRNSAFGGIVWGIYLSVISPIIIAFTHYNLIDYKNIWLPFFIIAIVTGVLLWKYGYDRSENAVKAQIPLLILISLFYAYPLIVFTNCMLDNSSPEITTSKILERHVVHNNGRDYCHVDIAVWYNGMQVNEDLHIDHELYDRIETQQDVHVILKNGLFHIPWI